MSDNERPTPPFDGQQQDQTPGRTAPMQPQPDHGEKSYKGSGRLAGKAAHHHGRRRRHWPRGRHCVRARRRGRADRVSERRRRRAKPARWVEKRAARRCWCRATSPIARIAMRSSTRPCEAFGRLDVLVNNAAYQMTYPSLDAITDDEWDKTFDTSIGAMFRISRAAVKHMKPGGAIVNTTSINADHPNPGLLAYRDDQGRDSKTSRAGSRSCSRRRAFA